MAGGRVVDIAQALDLVVAAVGLGPLVLGVDHNGPHGVDGPGPAQAVRVAFPVRGRRAGDTVTGEARGDGPEPEPVRPPGKDRLEPQQVWVDGELRELDSLAGLLGVRMGDPGPHELIAVGGRPPRYRPSGAMARIDVFTRTRRRFRSARLSPPKSDRMMSSIPSWGPRPPELGHPKRDVIVGQLGQHDLDLAGVAEGPLRFAHHDPRPGAARVFQLLEDGGRFLSL